MYASLREDDFMKKDNSFGGLYQVLEWLMWLFYINLLWVTFTIVGLVAFGFFPATAAMFSVFRGWLRKDDEVKITKTFLTTYKNGLLKANAIGFILVAIGYVLYLDFQLLGNVEGPIIYVLKVGFIVLGLIYVTTVLYIFPVFVHFELTFFQYFKNAMLFGIFSPFMSILMILSLVIINYLFMFLPGIIPVLGVSMVGLIITFWAFSAFKRFQNKQMQLTGVSNNEID